MSQKAFWCSVEKLLKPATSDYYSNAVHVINPTLFVLVGTSSLVNILLCIFLWKKYHIVYLGKMNCLFHLSLMISVKRNPCI